MQTPATDSVTPDTATSEVATTQRHGVIVVGVDGSIESKHALEWAIVEARLRGAKIHAVMGWMSPYRFVGLDATVAPPMDDVEDQAEKVLHHTIEKAVGEGSDRPVIEPILAYGSASSVLIHASERADLLVVGARGFGGFLGLILGSTADQVVKHAKCPVVVVRDRTSA
jgi:nucleotide-binding universal stress UspA family protein